MEWDDEKSLTLINLYKINELLWNPKHRDHKSRPKRFHVLNEIANHLDTNVSEIERKIKNLTSQYYRERKKLAESIKADTDSVYQSKWFAFKSFSFLQNRYNPTATTDMESPAESNDAQQQQYYSPQTTAKRPMKRPRKDPVNEMVSKALNIMKSVAQRQNEPKDEDAVFGEYIAAKLRNMDKTANAIVRHRINNIIFEAETGYRPELFLDSARPSKLPLEFTENVKQEYESP